jgi:hypothetical protein
MQVNDNSKSYRRTRGKKKRYQRRAPKSASQTQVSYLRSGSVDDYYRLSIKPGAFPLPRSLRTTLPYYEQVNLVSNSTPFIYVFRMNGPYDPNQTGSGAQPVGWDNMLTFYNQAFCVGSRIEVRVVNNGTVPLQFGIAPTNAANSLGSFDAMEYYSRDAVFGECDGTGRGGRSVCRRFNQMEVLRFYAQPYDADFVSAGQALPGRNAFWTVAFQSADQTTLVNANVQFRVYYDVIFTSPIPVALS